jgi:hypothetical protein
MAQSSQSTENAKRMLRDLVAAEALAESLAATAPIAVAAAGGAHKLVARLGQPTGAWFWSVSPLPESLWEQMADENQQTSRVSSGCE